MKKIYVLIALILFSCAHEAKRDPSKVEPLDVGEKINDVMIRNLSGESLSFKSIYTKKPTVLVIYRGGWCPYCNTQLSKLRKVIDKIEAKGYHLIAVSPDKPESLKESIDKNKITEYKLYSDSQLELAQELGLAFKVDDETIRKYKQYGIDLVKASGEDHKSLPVPAVYIIDRAGTVRYRFYEPNYKVRLEENVLIEELDKL